MGSLKTSYLVATGVYCAAIFWLSQQSKLPLPENEAFTLPGIDKLAHCFMYGGLVALLSKGIRESNDPAKPWVQWFVPVGFAILYGLSDEVHQLYVRQRDFEWLDLAADGAGATLAQLGLYRLWRKPGAGP